MNRDKIKKSSVGMVAISAAISFFALQATAQKQEYDMLLFGKKVGTITTDRKQKGDIELYTLVSRAQSKILWKEILAETEMRLVFKQGKLTESFYEHKENGTVEKYCKINPDATGKLAVFHWKNGKFFNQDPVDFCLISMYYKEPREGQRLFMESWGEFVQIKKSGSGQYEFKAPDGDRNIFRYTNGKLSETEFHTSIVSVKLKPRS
jgi:hypothetical protein